MYIECVATKNSFGLNKILIWSPESLWPI